MEKPAKGRKGKGAKGGWSASLPTHTLSSRSLQKIDHCIKHAPEAARFETSDLFFHDRCIGREKLARTSEAYPRQRTISEICVLDAHGHGIRVGIAGDLTQYPIASTGWCQSNCRTQLAGRKIGKWERDQDYGTRCRCDHASSSSGRFQSWPSDISLKSAVSETSASSNMVTIARHGCVRLTGSRKRTSPSGPIIASIDFSTISSPPPHKLHNPGKAFKLALRAHPPPLTRPPKPQRRRNLWLTRRRKGDARTLSSACWKADVASRQEPFEIVSRSGRPGVLTTAGFSSVPRAVDWISVL